MKNIIVLGLFIIVIISCQSNRQSFIQGKWIDKKNENIELTIDTEGNKLILRIGKNEFYLEKNNNYEYLLKSLPTDYRVNLDKETQTLFVNGIPYIRESESLTKKIRGAWVYKSKSKDTIFDFKEAHFSNTCLISIQGSRPEKYYPKKIENGFEFTINGKWIRFIFSEDRKILSDGNGNIFEKVN